MISIDFIELQILHTRSNQIKFCISCINIRFYKRINKTCIGVDRFNSDTFDIISATCWRAEADVWTPAVLWLNWSLTSRDISTGQFDLWPRSDLWNVKGSKQSGDFPSQSPPFRGAKYRTSPVEQVRHTASCGFMVDPCGALWWPLRCNGLEALSAPYVSVVISPNMPSHIPTEWDPLHTKHSISLQSLGPSE